MEQVQEERGKQVNKVLFSKKSDDWSTPKELYDIFMNNGYIDPCPLKAGFDGLNTEWPSGSKFYINPPYSNISSFVEFGLKQLEDNGATEVVYLVPSRTDTKWFQKLLNRGGTTFQFIKGRLKFGNSNNSAPFPSVLITIYPIPKGDIKQYNNEAVGIDLAKLIRG